MEADLYLDLLGEAGEAPREFDGIGLLPRRLAQEELIVDEVQRQLGVAGAGGESLEVPLCGDGGPGPESIPVVGAEDRGELGRLEVAFAGEERLEVRPLPVPPEP
jgi:hypothetical protein